MAVREDPLVDLRLDVQLLDPRANTRAFPQPPPARALATAGAADPVRPAEQGTYGGEMEGEAEGPPGGIEQTCTPGPQGPSQSGPGAT